MCGIVGGVAQRDIADILVAGLQRLEYRGYDSAGVAVITSDGQLNRLRKTGKVAELAAAVAADYPSGGTGIAHTRWATHGEPNEANAHPHLSSERIAVVHNGIIENHHELRDKLRASGYEFSSQTDTEVLVHQVHEFIEQGASLLEAVQKTAQVVKGAYGTVLVDKHNPNEMVVARSGSPLVIGLGIGENFIASDQLALLEVTRKFIYLEEGDVAHITRHAVQVFDVNGQPVERPVKEATGSVDAADKGEYRHYMLKEIFEQPTSVRQTLEGRISTNGLAPNIFGQGFTETVAQLNHIQIVACGTSYHAAMVARYWLEQYAGVSCNVEIASEFRYRKFHTVPGSMIVTISQSGETADTLAALRLAKEHNYLSSLAICNVDGSSLVRESDFAFMTRAGAEIGVASTKAFTTQLVSLLMLTLAIADEKGINAADKQMIIDGLLGLPAKIEQALTLSQPIEALAEEFAEKHHALFLGRGDQYPIAMEGSLKLKEISYIHAEAYAAGELKHGPIALIDADMPVIVVAPNNELLEKLHSNVEEVRARGGVLYVFADADANFKSDETQRVINVVNTCDITAPMVYTIPLQLLSYYVALIKGTDVDQPRNLAKSVTVE
ncbi:glutamine--fructose-6-phosphate transaminase (isomerizing) [Saccharobesus litoralis]|uniref:Glutamine--fructose-6-phosphate aminotransferase [isomerizing] n=1 Tax=Saccharobesus litoralis TaxID=2172099 RepID=A0A2S0VQD4_9ALTE|nr:glutamine--fructose-6-phosphate transaminase (isomerizing) [Saccharobesus litoralis]AWB66425.1 glutamine--fructose-6-phosphate transaminase (isomerizing) [Saccharobesus litoralis]